MNIVVQTLTLLVILDKACLASPPKISGTTISATSEVSTTVDKQTYLFPTYGEDITLFCSADDSANLSVENDGKCLNTTKLNTTTIQGFIKKPLVGKYEYICRNSENGGHGLIVKVMPSFFISAPRVRHLPRAENHPRPRYFVPRGEEYVMLCTGIKPLYIYDDRPKMMTSVSVNLTTVKIEAKADSTGVSFYSCTSQGYNGVALMNELRLIVDFYPEAFNFQCISFGLHWRRMECVWTSSSKQNSFKLFLVENYNKRRHLLCSYGSGATSRVCSADNSNGSGSLLLETCNEVFCDNKTFTIEHESIVILPAPSELELLNRSSNSVTLKWYSKFAWYNESEFKVEYRLLGAKWKQANSSLIKIPAYSDYCTLELALPCSDSHYEIRVLVKHTKAIEDRFWSEPTPSLFFFTDPQNTGELDPACNAALQDPEPITSVETAFNEIGKLIRQTTKEKISLKEKISGLRLKMAKIKAFKEQI